MRAWLLAAAIVGAVTALPGHAADDDSGEGPVPYRGGLERAAALPGRLLYAPFWLTLEGGKLLAAAVWEQHALERMSALLTTADGRSGVRPLSNTHLGTGARLFHRHPSGATVGLLSTFGRDPAERRHHRLSVALPAAAGRAVLAAQLLREPGESFYGVGMDSERRDRTRFTHEVATVELQWTRERGPVDLHTRLAYRAAHIHRAGDGAAHTIDAYGPDALPGLHDAARHVVATVAVRGEFVDVPGSPRNGNISLVQAGAFAAVDGSDLSYLSLLAVSEQYRELFYGRAVSLRGGLDWRVPFGDDAVPFYDLASVGGNLFVRGYQRGRFRDRGAAFAATRYKFPIWKRLDGTLFYEAGRTFSGVDEMSLRRWRSSWGGGVRVWVPRGVVFDQWVAFSDEEWRLLFSFRTDF